MASDLFRSNAFMQRADYALAEECTRNDQNIFIPLISQYRFNINEKISPSLPENHLPMLLADFQNGKLLQIRSDNFP